MTNRCLLKDWKTLKFSLALITALTFLNGLTSLAQIPITSTAPILENFNGMGTNTNLPGNWRFHRSTSPSFALGTGSVGQVANSGTPVTGGFYNWGAAGSDRAPGVMSSGSFTSPSSLMTVLTNANTSPINELSVSYSVERYRRNNASASVQFFYSLDGSTWISVPAGNVAAASLPTGTSVYSFNPPNLVLPVSSFTITGLSLSTGNLIYLRWNLNTTGANSQGIGIDDVSITAGFTPPCSAPLQASNLSYSAITGNSLTLSWVIGGGAGRVVKMNSTNSFTAPVDGSNPTATTAWSGSEMVVFNGTGSSVSITGLDPSTTYWFRVYEYCNPDRNYQTSTGTANPMQVTTTAGGITPTVFTTSVSAISTTSALSGGNVTDDGGSAITSRGIVWSNTPNPVLPGLGNETSPPGMGLFSGPISALNPETQYHVRAYASNSNGIAYGNSLPFFTRSNPPIQQAANLFANGFSSAQIDLSWDDASFPSTGASVKGYILLRSNSPEIPSFISTNGQAPAPGPFTSIVDANIASNLNSYSNVGLSPSTTYNYLLIPFCWDGINPSTYNYLTTGAPTSTGTTLSAICSPPSVSASSTILNTVNSNSISFQFTNGNGDSRLIAVSSNPISVLPENGVTYTSSNQFGVGDNLGSFTYVISSSSANNINVTGLNSSTTYYFSIWEYSTVNLCYLTSSSLTFSATTLSATNIVETFEPASKNTYANGVDLCNLGIWNFEDALVGTEINDKKLGLRSARIRNTGSITMQFDKPDGIGLLSVRHARYGNDGISTWRIEVSDNGGATFNAWVSPVITSSSLSLVNQNFSINISGNIRIRLKKLSGGGNRINFDEISFSNFTPSNIITTNAISGAPFCIGAGAGQTISVQFSATGTYNPGNIFTAQLSDENGSFAIPRDIGFLNSTNSFGNIASTIPSVVNSGSGYRIRVISSDPVLPDANIFPNNANLTILQNAPDVSLFNGNVISGNTVQLNWSLPSGCFDEIVIIGRESSPINVTLSGDGSSYTSNSVFGTAGSGTNLPTGHFAVFKAITGTSVNISGLTSGSNYYFKIFLRRGLLWSDGVIISIQPNNQTTGDFRSVANGSWTSPLVWERFNGTIWQPCSSLPAPNQWPGQDKVAGNPGTSNVTIRSGHTITLSSSLASNAIRDLTVNLGGKLFTNSTVLNGNRYLTIYGNIRCSGEIGNGSSIYDNISFNLEGNPTTISGTGIFNACRVRKNFNTNSTSHVIIAMNIGLRFAAGIGNSSGTQLYNNAPGTTFNVTINENTIVNLNKDVGLSGNIAIDGVDGEGSGERGGLFIINGILNIPGTLFMLTNNAFQAVEYVIGTSGIVNCVSVCTGNTSTLGNGSNTGSAILRILEGGKLNMTDNKPFNLRSNTVSPYQYVSGLGLNNNIFDFRPGSTIQYSSETGEQPIITALNYPNLLLTGGAIKSISGILTISGNLTMEFPSVLKTNNNAIHLRGDWRNYNQSGFDEGNSQVLFNGNITQNMVCPGGESFFNLNIINSSPGGLTLRDDITVAHKLDLSNLGRLTFGSSPHICRLLDMANLSNSLIGFGSAFIDMTGAEHFLFIGCENPGYIGNFDGGTSSLVNYNRSEAFANSGNQNIISGISYTNLSLSGSGQKLILDNTAINQSIFIEGSNTSLECHIPNKSLQIGGNLSLTGGGTMGTSCLDNLELLTIGISNQIIDGQNNPIYCSQLSSAKSSGSLSLQGPLGRTNLHIKNDLSINYTNSALFSDNGNNVHVGDDVELGSLLSSTTNYALSGTLILNALGFNNDLHISGFNGLGFCRATLNNVNVSTGNQNPGQTELDIYPLTGSEILNIRGNLTINQGSFGSILNANSNIIKLGGNWTNYNQSAFIEGQGTIEFTGNTQQSITCSGGERFYNMKIDNSNPIGVILNNGDLEILHTIDFTNGKLDLNTNDLILGTPTQDAQILGGNTSSYAILWYGLPNGWLRQRVNNNQGIYRFPVGDAIEYSPFEIEFSNAQLSEAIIHMGMATEAHPALGSAGDYITKYWLVEPNGIENPVYSVKYQYADADINGTESSLKPAKYNPLGWQMPTGSGAQAEIGSGSMNNITNQIFWSGLTTFSEFTALGGGSPLPIELLDFSATPEANHVALNWTTASETNNAWFEVERSINLVDWEMICRQPGAGNSNTVLQYADKDLKPLKGIAYYRLKQSDFNGTTSLSKPVAVRYTSNDALWAVSTFIPQGQTAQIILSRPVQNLKMEIFDAAGRIVQTAVLDSKTTHIQLNTSELSRGLYSIRLHNAEKVELLRMFR